MVARAIALKVRLGMLKSKEQARQRWLSYSHLIVAVRVDDMMAVLQRDATVNTMDCQRGSRGVLRLPGHKKIQAVYANWSPSMHNHGPSLILDAGDATASVSALSNRRDDSRCWLGPTRGPGSTFTTSFPFAGGHKLLVDGGRRHEYSPRWPRGKGNHTHWSTVLTGELRSVARRTTDTHGG